MKKLSLLLLVLLANVFATYAADNSRVEKKEYFNGGKITYIYYEGKLLQKLTEYDNGEYESYFYGQNGFWVRESYRKCSLCNGSKVCGGCHGSRGIYGAFGFFMSCMACGGSGRCNWCDDYGWKKETTTSNTPPAAPLYLEDDDDNYNSSSSDRYGYYSCPSCYGSGKCQICNGSKIQENSYTSTYSSCNACNGTGRCSSCNGTGKKYGVK